MPFSSATLRFFRDLARHNNKPWFEAHRADYERDVKDPMRELIELLDVRLARFAPEITGDPKRSLFRINRDIRFSKDKSPYKTNAACWFWHRDADPRVGDSAEAGGAGFYFHLGPKRSLVGAGIWMPPRPLLARLREGIAERPQGFEKVVKNAGFLRRFGGLDDEAVLKRVPRGFNPEHRAASWLRYQSFTAGRSLSDRDVVGGGLLKTLEANFKGLLPLVRWLNGSLGLKAASRR
ncbi:MAG TPA: DUF2461 domain-containing protein [Gemmatimonadales bacterium]|nr:DUF2461 domain-containing protein [Gemmatimonadales bacterium]